MRAVGALMMMMTLLALARPGHGKTSHPDLSDIETDIANLENSRQQLYSKLNEVVFTLDVAQRLMDSMQLRLSNRLTTANQDQLLLINSMKEQAKALKHQARHIQDHAEEAAQLADNVASDMPGLASGVNGLLSEDDTLDAEIGSMNQTIDATGPAQVAAIDQKVDNDLDDIHSQSDNLVDLVNAVQSRRCNYGTFLTAVPGSGTVSYVINFQNTPSVTYSIIGFRSHITDNDGHDKYSYGSVDLLGFNITIIASSSDVFKYAVSELEDSSVEPKDLFVRYMACENLDL